MTNLLGEAASESLEQHEFLGAGQVLHEREHARVIQQWAFSEAACFFLRVNEQAQHYLSRLVSKHGKGKALSIFAHKIGRAVYFMLKRKEPFNMDTFFAHA